MSEQLRESVRQTVRESVNPSFNGELMLSEGLIDKVKEFFSGNKADQIKNIILRGNDRVAILSFSEETNQYGFAIFDRDQKQKEKEAVLNGRSELDAKLKELKDQGFEEVNDASLAERMINLVTGPLGGAVNSLSSIVGVAMGAFLIATSGGILPLALGTGQVSLNLISFGQGIWVIKKSNAV